MTGTLLDVEDMRYELMWTYINVSVALQIRGLRQRRGWTQEDLAKAAGMHQEQIVLLEQVRWKHSPTIETLKKVGAALNVALKIRFDTWSSLISEFMAGSDITLPEDFQHDPVFQAAMGTEPEGSNDR